MITRKKHRILHIFWDTLTCSCEQMYSILLQKTCQFADRGELDQAALMAYACLPQFRNTLTSFCSYPDYQLSYQSQTEQSLIKLLLHPNI